MFNLDEFSMDELEAIDEMSDFYKKRMDRINQQYKNGNISVEEMERRMEPLLEELMNHRDEFIAE